MSWCRPSKRPCFRLPRRPSARPANCVASLIPRTGDIKAFAKLVVSEKVLSKHDQISVFDARRIKADAQLGEELEVEVTPAGFGRIASQYAKQALMQHIRRAEKQLIFTEFKDRVGTS
jgi:transcription termination/antitermination protein NusA